jgi:hypothetical protein
MRTILFECPFTGVAISTGIETVQSAFAAFQRRGLGCTARPVANFMELRFGLIRSAARHGSRPEKSRETRRQPPDISDSIDRILAALEARTSRASGSHEASRR